jgi:RHS repeat-associated protein
LGQRTDGTGTFDYDAWGNAVNTTGSTPNLCLYRGEQYDPDLNLYYLRARYFNPLTGRFLSRDPAEGHAIDPQTLHRYLYVGADPVNRIDPSGRDFFRKIWTKVLLVQCPGNRWTGQVESTPP